MLHTGDLFRTDAEGFLYFVGRKDDIIKTRGEKVQPEGGRERPLRAARRPRGGGDRRARSRSSARRSRPWSCGGLARTLTRDDVIRHCARHLEDFMVPKDVDFRDALPKTENGKINRREIAEREPGAC